jgi:hypothetical protein
MRHIHDGEKYEAYQSLKKIREELQLLDYQGRSSKTPPG